MSTLHAPASRALRSFGFAIAMLLAGATAAQATDSSATLLARANAAFAAERMAAPAGDNALEWTLAARDLEPGSARVQEGINDLFPLVVTAIDRAIARGDADEAGRMILLLDRAIPGSLAARQLRDKLVARFGDAGAQVALLDPPR
jgi:protein TonB